MFAMWLHLKHSDEILVEYEPEWAVAGDYVVDFVLHRPEFVKFHKTGVPIVSTHIELIEYKPSVPTVSYCSETARKLMRIAESIPDISEVSCITMNIIYGSVYTNDRGAFLCSGDKYSSIKHNWLGKYEKQIREYRFDLESEE
jgi:hypothetical protein